MADVDHHRVVTVHLDESTMARISALSATLRTPAIPLTRSDVLRGLLGLGLDLAEQDPSSPEKPPGGVE